jgi:hypothetical protein
MLPIAIPAFAPVESEEEGFAELDAGFVGLVDDGIVDVGEVLGLESMVDILEATESEDAMVALDVGVAVGVSLVILIVVELVVDILEATESDDAVLEAEVGVAAGFAEAPY